MREVVCGARYRHLKSGGEYTVLLTGKLEATGEDVVIYQSETSQIWVRPLAEFVDGRFQPVGVAPATIASRPSSMADDDDLEGELLGSACSLDNPDCESC
jgi:hypothetical protein